MAFPRKSSRQLVVDGVRYRFRGTFCERDRIDGVEVNELRVQLAANPRRVVRAEFTYARVAAEYARVGRHVSRWIDSAPPYVIRKVVELALARGHRFDEPGSEIDLGLVDDDLDWSQLA